MRADALRPLHEAAVVFGREEALLDGQLADRRLQHIELADLVAGLDRRVVVVIVGHDVVSSAAGTSQPSATSVSTVSDSRPV